MDTKPASKNSTIDATILRQKAEELIKKKFSKPGMELSEADTLKLIHELQVHQIELELQYEELDLAKEQAEIASRKYAELYDFAPSGYFTLSDKGEIIELNLFGAQMLGKERSKLRNNRFVFFVSDDTKPIFNLFLGKLFTSKARESCEIALSTNGNSPIVVHLTGIVSKNGEQCFITAIDITEHKQTEEALTHSYDLNTLFMRYSPIYAYIKEVTPTESRVLLASENFREMVGIPGSEMVGKTMTELFPTEFAAKITADDWSVVSSGQMLELDEDLIGRNFTTIKFPIKLKDRNLLAGYTIDITERKRAETEQQKITERLSLACRAGGIGIWELDVVDNNLIWDDQMFKLYGIMPDQFTGTYETWRAGVLPNDLPRSEEELQMALSGNKDFNTEFQVVWPDGTIHSIRALADVQKDSSGNAVGLIGTNYDITEIKQMESEIRHKNKELQKLNAEKDKFFSIIAHDLKSPFNSFLGLTQIMAEELPNLTMAQVQEIAVSMSKSATNLYRLLENLLQWSRMQQGSIPFNPEFLQLLQVVEECIEMIKEPAKNKGIEINYDIPGDLAVFADSNILQTVIRNMVTNAEKFTPKGGKISVSAKVLIDKSVEISIKDTGIGMSQSMVENLFRLDVPTNRKGTEGEPSSGLGLFLCYEFIKKHGGKIWVESEEGKGSEFKITLPVGN